MCKFCEMKPDEVGTMIVPNKWRTKIEQGALKFNVMIDRLESGEGYLWTDVSVGMHGKEYVIENHEITINYCPFCGEKLVKTE